MRKRYQRRRTPLGEGAVVGDFFLKGHYIAKLENMVSDQNAKVITCPVCSSIYLFFKFIIKKLDSP